MRLDAVYVLAPAPKPPSMPTRRAFLLAGGMFALGTGIGGAAGYALGSGTEAREATTQASEPDEWKPSGDADLDALRRLAVKAPIEQLIEYRLQFLSSATKSYRTDPILWRGIRRLGEAILADENFPDRRISARLIVQAIEMADAGLGDPHQDLARQLRGVR